MKLEHIEKAREKAVNAYSKQKVARTVRQRELNKNEEEEK